jgi:hypothetical protein
MLPVLGDEFARVIAPAAPFLMISGLVVELPTSPCFDVTVTTGLLIEGVFVV